MAITPAGHDLVFVFDGYDPAEVWEAALQATSPFLNGFVRNSVTVASLGGQSWKVTVSYGTSGP